MPIQYSITVLLDKAGTPSQSRYELLRSIRRYKLMKAPHRQRRELPSTTGDVQGSNCHLTTHRIFHHA